MMDTINNPIIELVVLAILHVKPVQINLTIAAHLVNKVYIFSKELV